MQTIRVAQFGLGPIGTESLRLLQTKPWAHFVGGIDIDPAKAGANVYPNFAAMCEVAKPDVVIHTAGSKARQAIEQIIPIARAGVSVVSSCEELLFPYHRARDAANQLDRVCKESGARVVGTGVNPGFVMDLLPICLMGVCKSVEAIRCQRVVNASTRRGPLQKKIGSGMKPDEFKQLFNEGKAGHAGFQESISLIAHCMGWTIEKMAETCEPVVAKSEIRTKFFHVKPGETCGLHQQARAIIDERERISLDLKMYLDAPDPHDAVQIEGSPPIDLRINNGVAGDEATIAALINAVPRLLRAEPGLRLITELPLA